MANRLRVLCACEESQEVTKAFRARGHEAYSCDLLPCSGGHPEWHYQQDVTELLNKHSFDIIIAHPPCTRLCLSGVRWLKDRNLWQELAKAMKFFNYFTTLGKIGYKVVIENPIPHKYARDGFIYGPNDPGIPVPGIGKYSQLIQPFQFGHGERKATCLWLYNLPLLKHSKTETLFESSTHVKGREQRIWKMAPGPDRAKNRSKTFPGIAKAMAEQWSPDLKGG